MDILQRLSNPTEEDLEDGADPAAAEDDISNELESLDIGEEDKRYLCQVLIIVGRFSRRRRSLGGPFTSSASGFYQGYGGPEQLSRTAIITVT
jgi:hypothetical protein